MKTAGEIIDALHKAGATLVVEEGKTRVRGTKVPDELLAAVKANKADVLAEWQRWQEKNLDRYAVVPGADAPLLARDEFVKPFMREAVVAYVFRQPRPLHAWVMSRAVEYHALGVPVGEDEVCACVDVLAWQRNTTAKLGLEWLEGIEEVDAQKLK